MKRMRAGRGNHGGSASARRGGVRFFSSDDVELRRPLLADILKTIGSRTDHGQVCSDFLSAITCILPTFGTTARTCLEKCGYLVTHVCFPTSDESNVDLFTLRDNIMFNMSLLYLGQLVIILLKEINEANFDRFMLKRTQALLSVIGIWYPGDELPMAIQIKQVKVVRQYLWNKYDLKKELFLQIQAGMENRGPFQNLCYYLLSLLEWNQMEAIKCINDRLILSNSPVIHDDRVANEVLRFSRAIATIHQNEPAQYFKILAPPELHHIVNKDNFGTLLAVAQHFSSEIHGHPRQYYVNKNVSKSLVTELINVDKVGRRVGCKLEVKKEVKKEVTEAIRFLLGMDKDMNHEVDLRAIRHRRVEVALRFLHGYSTLEEAKSVFHNHP